MKPARPKFTKAFILPASAIVATAAADLMRLEKNTAIRDARARGEDDDRPIERYAFHPGDVRNSKKPSDILEKAGRRLLARKTVHRIKNRVLLYGDISLLRKALTLALKTEAGR